MVPYSISTVMDPPLPTAGDQVEACNVARYAANQKGGHHLIDAQGFLYRLKRSHVAKDKKYWECTQKKTSICSSTALTRILNDSIISVGPHSHSINKVKQHVRQIEAAMVTAAATAATVVPRTVAKLRLLSLHQHLEPHPTSRPSLPCPGPSRGKG